MVAFVYKPRTALDHYLRLLGFAVKADTYESVLSSLGEGIKNAVDHIELEPDDDGVVDYEAEIIENILGTAFVVCQAQANAVLQAALKIPKQTMKDYEIRKLGPRFDKDYSKVEILWALANYFKHRDAWGRSMWTNPGRLEKSTIEAIKAAGLTPGSSSNLRDGAKALGNVSFTDVRIFYGLVRDWSEKVSEHIRMLNGR
jgi:hypothetical protein